MPFPTAPTNIVNWIDNNDYQPANCAWIEVTAPATGEVIGQVMDSTAEDVERAIASARAAFPGWSGLTSKARALKLHRLFELIRDHTEELADSIVREHGKTKAEAVAEVNKGNETVEYACSFPVYSVGKVLEVSRGVRCEDSREPIGVVSHIVPFNFPAMVPLWTIPIALAAGNCMILKPSEKVPITMTLMARLFQEAGFPPGVFNIVHGAKTAVQTICSHPAISAVTFVGSTPVAELVAARCQATGKRVLAMGGAKNHLVALPDCELNSTAEDIVGSFTGCAGQRCMAASVLIIVDPGDGSPFVSNLLELVLQKAQALRPGSGSGQMGPLIDRPAVERVVKYLEGAESRGANVLLDGRRWNIPNSTGYWIGPTIIHFATPPPSERLQLDPCMTDEVFGPLLSIVTVQSASEALRIENNSPFGNAACIYTSSGANAEYFVKRFTAAMLGINIGVPVPREPFSFGGMGASKFGNSGDVTGEGAVEFFTRRRKLTSRWPTQNAGDNLPWFR